MRASLPEDPGRRGSVLQSPRCQLGTTAHSRSLCPFPAGLSLRPYTGHGRFLGVPPVHLAPLGSYPYRDPAYRKNATRETPRYAPRPGSTSTAEPLPHQGRENLLATIITKMTLTQVSTWFANLRRRLKKENKMTWTPGTAVRTEEEEGTLIWRRT